MNIMIGHLGWGATALAGVLLAISLSGCGNDASAAAKAAPAKSARSAVERGQYLVTVAGCNDCHTPVKMGPKGPEPDMSRMLSGHPESLRMPPAPAAQGPWLWSGAETNTAFAGPWGVSYATNLTPDQNTGIGVWTEDIFVKTLRTGRHWGVARPILPPMPWQNYSRMSDEDLAAIYAYLRSIPAVHNRVPEAAVAPPPAAPAAR
ncbi:MAG TPA: c-type cytochrome [Thermoanaerobaculia bacterium]|nr:c-type cytochrome [Thermoanaerobaculia bacterium]